MNSQNLCAAVAAAVLLFVPVSEAIAQVTARPDAPAPNAPTARTYRVAKGDTLVRVAAKTTYPGVTANQMALALYAANPGAFLRGNINMLIMGQVLTVPPRETVVAVDAAQAGEKLRKLAGAPAAPPVVKAPPAQAPVRAAVPAAKAAKVPSAMPGGAAERFGQGEAYERGQDMKAALGAYTESAKAGYGPAQKKLGDIYGHGNAFVKRDYMTSLKWYEKARDQGIEVPKPKTYPLTETR